MLKYKVSLPLMQLLVN